MPPTPRPLGPGFRALFAGSLISNTGDGIRLAALPLLATELTSSPLLVSAVTAAQFVPWITVAPIGGALVDRWDRRRTVLVTQAWRGAVMLCLAGLVAADVVAIWQLCIVAFLITAGEILVDPSIVAMVPTVVHDDQLDAANGRIASVEIVTNDVAGGPVGAAAFGIAPWLPFAIDAASYLTSVAPFTRVPPPPPRSIARASVRALAAEAAEGFRFLRRHRVLGPLTAAFAVYYLGASAGFGLLVVLVTDELGGGPIAFGALLATGAVGAVGGSLLGGRVSARLGLRTTLLLALGVQAVAMAGVAGSRSLVATFTIWIVHGAAAGVQIPVARSLQQRSTPNHLLGRVNVSARVITRGVIVVGALAAGAIASAIGVRWSFAAGAFVELVAAGLAWVALRSQR